MHGGPKGFQYRVYDAVQPNPQELQLTYLAEDGEEGFPGNITCKVFMKLTDNNAIDINYEAETDKPKIANMTNHSYFNLNGDAGSNADYSFAQLKNGNDCDHNWVLNTKRDITHKCASLESPKTGIVLDVYTDEPGIQMYTGNFLDGLLTGKKGITYNQRASVCLETQKYTDTPNKPEWPSAVLCSGEKYTSQCIFKFSVNK